MATQTLSAPVPTSDDKEPVVVFEDVSMGFDGKPVLKNISFRVAVGETRILLGPAGVGKSVLLKLANGLFRPDSGRITVFGQEVSSMPDNDMFALRSRIGMVFQESALFDSLTVRDNVAFRLIEDKVPEAEINDRVSEALRFVELEHTMDMFPAQLSGGMRRRVAIARAIVSKPDLLLYDSPTGGLDPITSTTIIELVVKQRDVSHTSSLLVTHRLQDAYFLATHTFNQSKNQVERTAGDKANLRTSFLMLREGELIFDGSTHDLLASQDPFIKEYLE